MSRARRNLPGDIYNVLVQNGPTTAFAIATCLNPRYSGNLTASRIGQYLRGLEDEGMAYRNGSVMGACIWVASA